MNNFFASVELLSLPELRDLPVAVCGDPQRRHGIILAKNNLAKKFGVATAETIWSAKKKCPQLELIPPHYDEYKKFTGINIDFDKEAIHPYVAKDTEELIKIIEREYNSDLMYEFRYKYVDKSLSNVTKRLGAFIDCI